MRALRIRGHGGPEVMRIEDVPVPKAGSGEVLVKIAAASVNPIDWKIRQGLFRHDLPWTPGRDGAGTDVATGERLLGIGSPGHDGTHAEYAVFSRGMTAPIPGGVTFEQAAAIGLAGLTALSLVENARVAAGHKVLVHGGAGGVGGFAIQIARSRDAEAWTTCSARNASYCIDLGARRVINYLRQDFAQEGAIFDAVLDTIGGMVHTRSAQVLKAGGVLAFLNAAPCQPVQRKDIEIIPTEVRATPERLRTLMTLGMRVHIQERYPLERAAAGYELSRAGHVRGKIILQVS